MRTNGNEIAWKVHVLEGVAFLEEGRMTCPWLGKKNLHQGWAAYPSGGSGRLSSTLLLFPPLILRRWIIIRDFVHVFAISIAYIGVRPSCDKNFLKN